ncbi:acetylornithine deacetylase [Penicillium brevicompactum]|uniref:Acetylornithine deacetylase n=1 Tax=Penicillium brevicompactum TaxID=5074 RepID=A0A9W9QYJ0_PENBR|nr:acetylornithine deacetylase [Penicillium brevicompactum]
MPISAELATSIADAVAAGFDDQLAYTQQLIRTGGQRGEEHAVQDLVYNRFSSHGYNPIRLEMDPDLLSQHEGAGRISAEHSKAPIVIGVHEPRSQSAVGKSLILNAHIDIVPTGPVDLWTRDPYSGDIEDDKLYGRGGADMRAGSAANLYALDALRRVGVQPASKVILESVVEEESTGNGTLMTHLKGYRADAVIIPEPMDEKLVRANVGVLWFQVEVKGIPVHVRDMGTGTNAIDACWRVVGGLRELEKEWNEKKIGRLHFENENHPLNLNVAKINAGDWASSVPAWCRIDCRIAIFPGVSAKSAAEEIEAKVDEVARNDAFLSKNMPTVTWNGFFSEGYVLEPDSEAEKTLRWAHQQATGAELQSFMTAAYLDTRIHSLYDKIPALCYGPISSNIHGFDEWVSISSLKRITTAIALYVAEWCGVEAIE